MPDTTITIEEFVRQLFAEHPGHEGHTQTLVATTDGGRALVCSCGVRLVSER
jgi:hypothetical protein